MCSYIVVGGCLWILIAVALTSQIGLELALVLSAIIVYIGSMARIVDRWIRIKNER